MTTFRANGKLLISGEYFILDGAKGLALPTKFGQTLSAAPSSKRGISWKSLDHENKIWFEAEFSPSLEIVSSTNNEMAETLKNILSNCPLATHDLRLTTKLEFPTNWGLGSSSTLISLLAQWTSTDPYELLAKTFGGSGYDIACATAEAPITFQIINNNSPLGDGGKSHISNHVNFNPAFKDHLYFIHLDKKQNSREGIEYYRNLEADKSNYIHEISDITHKLIAANELDEFCHYLQVHENIVSNVLKLPKVKETHFQDFPGTVKSLGAWGGDFILVASDESPEMITRYFREKGLSTVIPFDAMIL